MDILQRTRSRREGATQDTSCRRRTVSSFDFENPEENQQSLKKAKLYVGDVTVGMKVVGLTKLDAEVEVVT